VHQNLVAESVTEATGIARGKLAMRCCHTCGFVFNSAFDESLMDYGAKYDNTQNCSNAFNDYINELVRHLIHNERVQGCRIVEVGCGKGAFLRRLVAFEDANNIGVGFDPTYVGELSDLNGKLTFRKSFYDEQASSVPADVVICRHVIEHVPEPLTLLNSVRRALAGSPNARVYFETPCVDWILKNQVVWDFFYEHCSIFTLASLATAFETAGFAVRNVRHVFDGQYLWMEANVAQTGVEPTHNPGHTLELAEQFTSNERIRVERWQQLARDLSRNGRIAMWGAGAKGVTFANLVDPDRSLLDCVVDVNPAKQEKCLPGTGHSIISPEQLTKRGVEVVLVLNPNYVDEIQHWLDRAGLEICVVDLMKSDTGTN
jgi:SAM-dependent methyltransferase